MYVLSPIQCLVRSLPSYQFFVRLELSCARPKTWFFYQERLDDVTQDYLRSRSVTSSPSRNNCELFPDEPSAPTWPRVAKCWAWSTTSRSRFRKACQIVLATVSMQQHPLPWSTSPTWHLLDLHSNYRTKIIIVIGAMNVRLGSHVHLHNRFSKPIPETSCSNKVWQSNTTGLGFQCIPYPRSKRCWDIEICPITS